MLPNKAGQSAFLAPIHCEQFILFHLHFLYYSSSIENSSSMENQRKKEIMDVFSLVMAFLTSATSLAAALVQYQTAKIAASVAEGARIAASVAPQWLGISRRLKSLGNGPPPRFYRGKLGILRKDPPPRVVSYHKQ